MAPFELYNQRQHQFQSLAKQYETAYTRLSWLRVSIFILGILITFYLYNHASIVTILVSAVTSILAFAYCLKKHNQVEYKRDHYRFLHYINRDEASRLENIFIRPKTGLEFEDIGHFYTSDLDIFGKSSIYKLLNRTHSFGGAKKLAEALANPSTAKEIRSTQGAVLEISTKLDFRQELEASAMHYQEVNLPIDSLLQWVEEPEWANKSTMLKWARFLPVITIPLLLLASLDFIVWSIPSLMLLIHSFILSYVFKEVKRVTAKTELVAKTLSAYAAIINNIEKESFHTEKLQRLQSAFIGQRASASTSIKQLANSIRNLSYRNNPYFYILFCISTLWDVFFLIRIEKWKNQYRSLLPTWLENISEWEVLNSLAGFHYSNPDYVMPVISEKDIELYAEQVGHVLIPGSKRVKNNISLTGEGKTIVITGSNMSGKSTFLRTVGVNAILALAGAPVCAKSFRISVLQVFTSMRTQDSLEENVSSFYAELKRLKQLIEYIKQPRPVLYFLDEILKGTNSIDRHNGAKALIKQIHHHKASGFISTHDIELGKMAEENQEFVKNYSFSSEVVNKQLVFDYTLREGVCSSFNASKLMQQIGIEMDSE